MAEKKDILKVDTGEVSISTKLPDSLTKTTDSVSTAITSNPLLEKGPIEVILSSSTQAVPIKVKVSLIYNGVENLEIQGKSKFNYFDKECLDTLISLFVSGNKYVTPPMIYRAMVGKKIGTASPTTIKDIESSIDKCRFLDLKIDTGDLEFTNGNALLELSGNLLMVTKAKVRINGKVTEAYTLVDTPMIYKYALQEGLITELPLNINNTPVNKTKETLTLQSLLLSKICEAKTNRAEDLVILFDEIYGEVLSENGKTSTVRKNVILIMDYWVDLRFISSYRMIKEGKSVTALKVVF